MAVIAVIITAPLGAILTNTLGPMWLNHDEDYDPLKTGVDAGTSLNEMNKSMVISKDGKRVTMGTGPDEEMEYDDAFDTKREMVGKNNDVETNGTSNEL